MARIGIDVDGVLRDFPRAVVDAFKRHMPELVKSEVVTGYNFTNIDMPWKDKAKFIFNTWADTIYRHARPMSGVVTDFHRLKKWAKRAGHTLVCVTSNNKLLGFYTREWLDKYSLRFDEYHFLPHDNTNDFRPDKARVPIDYLVDDSPGVYEMWVKARGDDSRFILFDHPYNRDVLAKWRVSRLYISPQGPGAPFLLSVPSVVDGKENKGAQVEYDVQRAADRLFGVRPQSKGEGDDGTILDKAKRLIHGPRNEDYGHPLDDFTCTADMIRALVKRRYGVDVPFVAEDVAEIFMPSAKMSRQAGKHKPDNLVDLCGYTGTAEMVRDERSRREGQGG